MFKPKYSVGEVYHNPVNQSLYEILAVSPTPEYQDDDNYVWIYFTKVTDLLDDSVIYTSVWDSGYPDGDKWQLLSFLEDEAVYDQYDEFYLDNFKDDVYWI